MQPRLYGGRLRRLEGVITVPGMTETLIVIDAPHFYAGLIAENGRVKAAADIIRYMAPKGRRPGWTGRQVADYCREKGWTWEVVHTVHSAVDNEISS